jgi:hypothetical protein
LLQKGKCYVSLNQEPSEAILSITLPPATTQQRKRT